MFKRPEDGSIQLPTRNSYKAARLFATGASLGLGGGYGASNADGTEESGIMLTLPAPLPDTIDTVVAVQLDGPPKIPAKQQPLIGKKPAPVSK